MSTDHGAGVRTLRDVLDEVRALDVLVADIIPEGTTGRPVTSIRLLEAVSDLERAGKGELGILTAAASDDASDEYRLDVVVRTASSAGMVGILLLGDEEPRSLTAIALARKTGLSLLVGRRDCDLARVLLRLTRVVHGDVAADVERAGRALAAVAELEGADAGPVDLIRAAARELGRGIWRAREPGGWLAVPANLTVEATDYLCAEQPADAAQATVVELVLWRLSAAVTRHVWSAERSEEILRLSASDLLARLLDADGVEARRLARRAATLGIPIDGWHTALELATDDAGLAGAHGEAGAYLRRREIARLALDAAEQGDAGVWNVIHDAARVLLICSRRLEPARGSEDAAPAVVGRVLDRFPDLRLYAGLGTPHEGVAGLRATIAEAEAAAGIARAKQRVNEVIEFDRIGLRRALIEWYASGSVRQSVEDLLLPLERLGAARAATLVQTLGAYLDAAGSVSAAARALHVHRNTVQYRVEQALGLLNIDLHDPDERLMLHLACRARISA